MVTLPIQETLSEHHLRGIGLVIAQWAQFDSLLLAGICEIGHVDRETGLIIISGMDPRTKVGLLQTLVRWRYEDEADQFDKLAKRINKLYAQRNDYAHLRWEKGEKPGTIKPIGLKTVGTFKTAKGEVTATDIENLAYRVWMIGNELLAFLRLRGLLLNV